MSNSIQTFANEEFGSIRTVTINNEPWFIARDVASKLGYKNIKDAITDNVNDEDSMILLKSLAATLGIDTTSIPNRGLTCINESGLYSLILSSKLPSARKFQRWVTSEVLPTIRKTGAYMTPETLKESLRDPEYLRGILSLLDEQYEKNKKLSTDLAVANERNKSLTAANKALTGEICEWDWRACINSLVRAYGSYRLGGNFVMAWNTYYKHFNNKLGTNIRNRKSCGKRILDRVEQSEWRDAVRIAAGLCEQADIDVGNVLNNVNFNIYINATA